MLLLRAILEPPGSSWSEEVKNKILSAIPLGRLGTEKDIAGTVKFLVDSEYITGQAINVDGGDLYYDRRVSP